MLKTCVILCAFILGKYLLLCPDFRTQCFTTHQHGIIYISFPLYPLAAAKAFTIYNTQHSLCLEEAAVTGLVVLKRCNLHSESQQWTWSDEGMLVSAASSRCLSASQNEPVKTLSCERQEADSAQLMWDCDRDGLISRSTSMLLSVDGQQLTLTQGGKSSRWKSLEKADICQEKLERKFQETAGTRTPCFLRCTISLLIVNIRTKCEQRKVQQEFLLQDPEGRLIMRGKTRRRGNRRV